MPDANYCFRFSDRSRHRSDLRVYFDLKVHQQLMVLFVRKEDRELLENNSENRLLALLSLNETVKRNTIEDWVKKLRAADFGDCIDEDDIISYGQLFEQLSDQEARVLLSFPGCPPKMSLFFFEEDKQVYSHYLFRDFRLDEERLYRLLPKAIRDEWEHHPAPAEDYHAMLDNNRRQMLRLHRSIVKNKGGWSFRYRILLKKAFSQIQAWCLNEMQNPFLFLEFLEDKSNYTPQLYSNLFYQFSAQKLAWAAFRQEDLPVLYEKLLPIKKWKEVEFLIQGQEKAFKKNQLYLQDVLDAKNELVERTNDLRDLVDG